MTNFPFNFAHLPSEFSASPDAPCPYLANKSEQLLFIETNDIKLPLNINLLNSGGFRRSKQIFYKPICQKCNECQPIRIICADWQIKPSMARIFKKNARFTTRIIQNFEINQEHYVLMAKYIKSRHQSIENSVDISISEADFIHVVGLKNTQNFTIIKEWRDGDKLIAYIILDKFNDGISAVYSCFDPEYSKNSLGHFMIGQTIKMAQDNEYKYLYLGYFVEKSAKMNYKSQYVPAEILTQFGWKRKFL